MKTDLWKIMTMMAVLLWSSGARARRTRPASRRAMKRTPLSIVLGCVATFLAVGCGTLVLRTADETAYDREIVYCSGRDLATATAKGVSFYQVTAAGDATDLVYDTRKASLHAPGNETVRLVTRGSITAVGTTSTVCRFRLSGSAPDKHLWITSLNLRKGYGSATGEQLDFRLRLADREIEHKTIDGASGTLLAQYDLGKAVNGLLLELVFSNAAPAEPKADAEFYYTLELVPRGAKPLYKNDIVTTRKADIPCPRLCADGGPDPEFMKAQAGHQKALTEKNPELIILGDSVMHNLPGKILNARLGRYSPSNQAYGGDQTEHQLWRVLHLDYSAHNPKIALIMIGINNIADPVYSVGDVVSGMTALVSALRAQSPKTKILLLGILPAGKSLAAEPNLTRIPAVNAALAKLADGAHIFYADITRQMAEPDGTLAREIFYDGCHLSDAGFERFCDCVIPYVKTLFE